METSEVILQAGIEGGCITLYGMHTGKCWVFSMDVDDQTPELIGESRHFYQSNPAYSWQDALDLIKKYPWHRFFPLAVHPLFRGVILAAVLRRRLEEDGFDTNGLRDWLDKCGEIPEVKYSLAL